MKKIAVLGAIFLTALGFSQTPQDSTQTVQLQQNAAQRIMSGNINSGVTVGGYAQIDYNQPEGDNGKIDVHRMVLLFGYKFNERVQFVTEIELEHVKEVYVEQAFLNYSLTDNVNIRGGLMLVPMGIVNEYHEPTTFNGVERPNVDKYIVPTTWREIGLGITGKIDNASLRYQAYIMNGFKSEGLRGSDGLRKGRQKGAESTINSPTFSGKLDYYGIRNLRLGLSGYFGDTQPEDGTEEIEGSKVGIAMVGFDARYAYKKFMTRGQFIYASLSDTEAYNTLNSSDLGAALQGWYLEAAYNVLPAAKKEKLYAFARYENYDTHAKVDGGLTRNDAYNRKEWTLGLTYKVAQGAAFKADYQILDTAAEGIDAKGQFNMGIGVWF